MTDHRFDVLAMLADEIAMRSTASPETSYTAMLLSQGVEKCAKKFGEEAVELAILPERPARSADFLFVSSRASRNQSPTK